MSERTKPKRDPNVFISDRGVAYRVGGTFPKNWLVPAKAARVALGDEEATKDPLAWWCLAELLEGQIAPNRKRK